VADQDPPPRPAAGDRLEQALAAIDRANADDPTTIEVGGVVRPKEQAHAELAMAWVQRLDPGAGEAQLLAARAHHLRRWAVPRDSYPEGRAGYLRWRTAQKSRHAEEVAGILEPLGYPPPFVDRVQQIIRKEGLRHDPAVQTHEDALCLVFLETQLSALAADLGEDKTVAVVRKTAAKMSPAGLEAARSLQYDDAAASVLAAALAEE
jgi:hypothetical protein